MSKFIELYSGNRNRELYPLQSYFEVPFAAVLQNGTPPSSQDPVINGTILYTFTLYPNNFLYATGLIQPGSGVSAIKLDINQTPTYSLTPDFYKGFIFTDSTTQEIHIIRTYNPVTGFVTFEKPFTTITVGGQYVLSIGFPTDEYIYIPTVDDNGNPIDTEEQAYTGYYVVFETENPLWSNSDNSNIFYRRISYYDNLEQVAYFDKPLPFDLTGITTPLTFTLRKSLPSARWTLMSPTTYNYTPPTGADILRGPLVGPVIQLPPTAPDQDNIYKGQYVYFASNMPDFYSPPLPPPSVLSKPLSYVFYPIYGAYYIRAYNGQTKQLSVDKDIRNTPLPTFSALPYTSASFAMSTSYVSSVTYEGGTTYRAYLNPSYLVGTQYHHAFSPLLNYQVVHQAGRDYFCHLRVRKSPGIVEMAFVASGVIQYYSPQLTTDYQDITFCISPLKETPYAYGLTFWFVGTYNPADTVYIEWDLFEMTQKDTINITPFQKDNFSPLFYSGTMVGMNETVCYNVSLSSLVIPNLPLKTGSTIAFYPFLYVLLENVTAPSGASTNVIYSNNPNTARALFVAACFPTPDPSIQRYITLSSSTSHTIKFKPNDNLRFAIYLGDGTLLEPIVPDTLSPYEYIPRSQVLAVFSVTRLPQGK